MHAYMYTVMWWSRPEDYNPLKNIGMDSALLTQAQSCWGILFPKWGEGSGEDAINSKYSGKPQEFLSIQPMGVLL